MNTSYATISELSEKLGLHSDRDRLGYLSTVEPEHASRIHISNVMLEDEITVDLCISEEHPHIGSFEFYFGRAQVGWRVHPILAMYLPEFHFSTASLWVYPSGKSMIRVELHIPTGIEVVPGLFDADPATNIIGFEFDPQEVTHLGLSRANE